MPGAPPADLGDRHPHLRAWARRGPPEARSGLGEALMQPAAQALTQQFLAWVAEAPRSYADAEAWRRSCPHLSIWEDAISDGLVRYDGGSSLQEARLVLTPRGRAQLQNP